MKIILNLIFFMSAHAFAKVDTKCEFEAFRYNLPDGSAYTLETTIFKVELSENKKTQKISLDGGNTIITFSLVDTLSNYGLYNIRLKNMISHIGLTSLTSEVAEIGLLIQDEYTDLDDLHRISLSCRN